MKYKHGQRIRVRDSMLSKDGLIGLFEHYATAGPSMCYVTIIEGWPRVTLRLPVEYIELASAPCMFGDRNV